MHLTSPHSKCLSSARNSSTVSVQDPFAEVNDPVFQKCTPMNPGAPYHPQGGNMPEAVMRMQFEANKDPFGAARKGESLLDCPYTGNDAGISSMWEDFSHF